MEGNSPGLKLSTSLVPYYSNVSTFQVRPANLQPLIITPLCGARESLKDSVAAWVNYTLVAVHGKFLFNPNYWCNVCGQLRPPFLPTYKVEFQNQVSIASQSSCIKGTEMFIIGTYIHCCAFSLVPLPQAKHF